MQAIHSLYTSITSTDTVFNISGSHRDQENVSETGMELKVLRQLKYMYEWQRQQISFNVHNFVLLFHKNNYSRTINLTAC